MQPLLFILSNEERIAALGNDTFTITRKLFPSFDFYQPSQWPFKGQLAER
jgi:hypothetical protein